MFTIRLPEDIHARLENFTKLTGLSKSFYVREAILAHLDDLEDLYLAEQVKRRIQSGDERTFTFDEVEARIGEQSPSH